LFFLNRLLPPSFLCVLYNCIQEFFNSVKPIQKLLKEMSVICFRISLMQW